MNFIFDWFSWFLGLNGKERLVFCLWLLVIALCLFSMCICISILFEYYYLDNRHDEKGNGQAKKCIREAYYFSRRLLGLSGQHKEK